MNILIVSHLYPSDARPEHGLFIHEHVKALQRLGVKLRVIAPVPWVPPGLACLRRKWADYAKLGGRMEVFDGVPVSRPRYLALPGRLDFCRAWSLAATLRRTWKTWTAGFDLDLVHAHFITPDGFAACQIGKRFGRPVVCSARGSEAHQRPQESTIMKKMTGWTLRNCDAAVAVSGALARIIEELAHGAIKPNVVYNGVAQEFQSTGDRAKTRLELGLPSRAHIILFAGRCERDKGAGELLRAFDAVAVENASAMLVFAGEGGALPEVEKQARHSSWRNRARFFGHVPRNKLVSFYQAADVFVLPSYGEGMPNALLEAMATGLVCVATPVGGIPEVLQDGVNGLLVPVKSPGAIVAALNRIFASGELSARLGAAAARTIQHRFTWSANAEAHRAIYQEVLRKCQYN
jgi:hypothetical protein